MSIILLTCYQSYGQSKTEDVIYLKDGGSIGGTITENIPLKTITIKTRHGSTLVIKYDDIIKVTKEPYVDDVPPPDAMKYNYKDVKTGVVRFNFEFSRYWGQGTINSRGTAYNNEDASRGFKAVIGNQAAKNVIVGIGIGIDNYTLGNLFPITLDLKSFNTESKVSPYLNAFCGGSIGIVNINGGITFGGALGMKINLNDNIYCTLGFSSKWQSSEFNREQALFRFLGLNTGIIF